MTPTRYCPTHRTPIGPRGCARCNQEEMRVHREEQRQFWRWAMRGGIPLLLFGLVLALWPDRSEKATRLDAEPYRNAIETMESLLFRGDRLMPMDRDNLSGALQVLAMQLRSGFPTRAQKAAREGLEPFLTVAASEASSDRLDMTQARRQWEALRHTYFEDASWFLRTTPALEAAQLSAEARGVPPDAARYDQSLAAIQALLGRVRSYVDALPQNPHDLDGVDYDRWQSNRQWVTRDAQRIKEEFPLVHDGVDGKWRVALSRLERALTAVTAVMRPVTSTPTLVPSQGACSARVLQADAAIRSAAEQIDVAKR